METVALAVTRAANAVACCANAAATLTRNRRVGLKPTTQLTTRWVCDREQTVGYRYISTSKR